MKRHLKTIGILGSAIALIGGFLWVLQFHPEVVAILILICFVAVIYILIYEAIT